MNFNISFLISGIITIILGMLLFNFGLNIHRAVIANYNCLSCSIFDDECPEGYDTEENKQCNDSLEWPFKITFGIAMLGLVFAAMPFMYLIGEYMAYKQNKKHKQKKIEKFKY